MSSLNDFVTSQDDLIKQASETLPHSFQHCTYILGHIRQPVYLCITCTTENDGEPAGLCSSCSIACHASHEQLELFPKRNFRCDCPTHRTGMMHCTLQPPGDGKKAKNASNEYGRNFQRVFCRCGRPYDPHEEKETMIQCVACEDWYHESCLNLLDASRVVSRPPSRASSAALDESAPESAADDEADEEDWTLLPGDAYDTLICGACASSIPTVRKHAGTPGFMTVVREDPSSAYKVIGEEKADETSPVDVAQSGDKREHDDQSTSDERPTKRLKTDTSASPCLAPTPNAVMQKVYEQLDNKTTEDELLGSGDVFLAENWRQKWCKCNDCYKSLSAHPYLTAEEDTWEPPEDPDIGLSLEELGMRALEKIPRDRAIDGIRAFNEMRDSLKAFLQPFAEQGKEVSEVDIQAFFQQRREEHIEQLRQQTR